MASREDNLIPQAHVLTLEEQSRAGKKSGEVRAKKKSMREALNHILTNKITDIPEIDEVLKKYGVNENDVQNAILCQQVDKAVYGDLNSARFIRDTTGEYIGAEEPREERDDQTIVIPARDIAKTFVDINRDIDDREHREYYLEGGRGSTKSSFISEKIIELLENNPRMCAVVLRKVKDTMKDSVYSQLEWAVDKLSETYPDLKDDYKFTKSPLEIVKLSTGQRIYFRGADDYGKIKSLKTPTNMYVGITWYEEFDQFAGMNEVRKINQSLIRGGDDFIQFYSYNTPASSLHFVNVEKLLPKETRLLNTSSYLDVPKKWLGQAFIDEAEYLKSVNERLYQNEYLGIATGTGGNVFENLELREITDEEIKTFDTILCGIDWGYAPDPFAFNKMHYDKTQRIIYIYFELEERKKGNLELQDIMLDNGIEKNELIVADSNEPKSIGDFRIWGWNMRGAEKGPGSKEYGFKWLQTRTKIVIDPRRCPKTATEFSTYEYEQDKDGNYITGYPEGQEDHHIACTRYATERIWKKRGQ